jgi:pimeloyl-ACP methyl ester carboxylesterase
VAVAATAAPAGAAAQSHPAFNVAITGSGTGTPMILIPGLSSSGAVWDGTVRHYCGQRQCHVLTLAGFAGVAPITTALLATAEQQLSDYIAANRLGQPIVVGHSLGGFLGMKLAADHPDQVGRLVIVDTLPALGARQMPSITRAQLQEVGTGMREQLLKQDHATYEANLQTTIASMVSKPDDIALVMGWSRQSDRATVANAMYEMMTDDMRDDVARIKAPTLVLGSWIAYKQYAPRAAFEAVYVSQYQKLAGVKVELSDTARHFIMVDDPEWMYARIDQFLK